MVVIKAKINNRNSIFHSSKLYESDAIIELLSVIKKLFSQVKYKILEISNQIPPIQKEEENYLDRLNRTKLTKLKL